MRTLKASDNEALVLFGNPSSSPNDPDSAGANYCQLTSRHGHVTVGIMGQDHYTAEPGFWRRVGYMFGATDMETQEVVAQGQQEGL